MEKLCYFLYVILKNPKSNDQSFYNAYLGFSFLQYLNLASVFILINHFTLYRADKKTAFFLSLSFFGVILIFNFYKLLKKKDFIISVNESLPKNKKKIGMLLTWVFIVFSFVFFYLVMNNFGPEGVIETK